MDALIVDCFPSFGWKTIAISSGIKTRMKKCELKERDFVRKRRREHDVDRRVSGMMNE